MIASGHLLEHSGQEANKPSPDINDRSVLSLLLDTNHSVTKINPNSSNPVANSIVYALVFGTSSRNRMCTCSEPLLNVLCKGSLIIYFVRLSNPFEFECIVR